MSCSQASHELLRASGVAFRASTVASFQSWSVDDAGRDERIQYATCARCGSTIGIALRLLAEGNRHEMAARARKVAIILAQVPVGANRMELDALADCLTGWTQAQRDTFAAAAGASSPSVATWAEVVAAARGRLTVDEILARARGAEGEARA